MLLLLLLLLLLSRERCQEMQKLLRTDGRRKIFRVTTKTFRVGLERRFGIVELGFLGNFVLLLRTPVMMQIGISPQGRSSVVITNGVPQSTIVL
jgi:hypothetical protein